MFTVQNIEMTERYLLYPTEPSVTFRLRVWVYGCFIYSHNFFHEKSVQKIMIFCKHAYNRTLERNNNKKNHKTIIIKNNH